MSDPSKKFKLLNNEGAVVRSGSAADPTAAEAYAQENGLTIEWETPAPSRAAPHAQEPAPEPVKQDRHGTASDAWQGAQQGFSFGLADELQGFAAKMTAPETPRTESRGIDAPLSDTTSYDVERDAGRERLRQAHEDSPWAAAGGDLAASALTSLIPIGSAGKGLTGMEKYRQMAKVGAGLGAAEGATRSNAEVGSSEFNGDVAAGGTLGMMAGPVLGRLADNAAPALSRSAQATRQALLQKADDLQRQADALKLSAAGAQQPELRKMATQPGGHRRVVETMDKHGLGSKKRVPTKEDYHRDARNALDQVSANRAEIEAGATGAVDPRKAAGRIQEEVVGPLQQSGDRARERLWSSEAGMLRGQSNVELPGGGAIVRDMPLDDAKAWKSRYSEQAKYDKAGGGAAKRTGEQYKKSASILNEEIAEGIGERGPEWLETGQEMQGLMSIADLEAKAARQQSLRQISPSDYGTGATGAMVGGMSGGPAGAVQGAVAGVALNKIYRPREHQLKHMWKQRQLGKTLNAADRTVRVADDVAARAPGRVGGLMSGALASADGVYKTLTQKIEALAASNPEQLGPYGSVLNDALQRGPDHFRAYHSTLQQTDPEYQKLLRELEEGEYNEQPIGNGG